MSEDTYSVTADVYDAVYTVGQQKDYELEAARVNEIVKAKTGRAPIDMKLLDVACGTGLHLQHFARWYKHVEGLDLSEAMLAVAHKRLPNVPLYQEDMTSIMLRPSDLDDPTFDVVTCLFSAIGHLEKYDDLRHAIHSMAKHVSPGGVLIIEPWLTPETFDPTKADGAVFVDEPELKVARFATTTRDGLATKLRLDFMVKRPGQPAETFAEEHIITMWTENHFRQAFRNTGMVVTFDSKGLSRNGRGLYIATKPS